MSKLILVRHGESVWNKQNLFTGWTDVDLSEKGIEEAKNAGNLLKNENFDICFTSVLKRAIKTANNILNISGKTNIQKIQDWHLNERHYGALQGLNKTETAQKYGEEQVKLWRRSYNIKPPLLDEDDERNPKKDPKYKNITEPLPLTESLEDTVKRVIPFYESTILPLLKDNKNILIAAHGNSLRALCMYLEKISPDKIIELNIGTAQPFSYEFDNKMNIINKYTYK